jgi:DNA-directed RNA polymerase, mitochondrial
MVQTDVEMFDAQINLEEDMLSLGQVRYRDRIDKAISKNRRSSTPAARQIIAKVIDPFVAAFDEWAVKQSNRGTQGRRLSYLSAALSIPPDTLAVLALRGIIDRITEECVYTSTCIHIGRAAENELRYRTFLEAEPKLCGAIIRRLRKSNDSRYKHKVLIQAMNKSGVEWHGWTDKTRLGVGALAIHFIEKIGLVYLHSKRSNNNTTIYVVQHPDFAAWCKEHDNRACLLSPVQLPCVITPREWTDSWDGGYHSARLGRYSIVKTSHRGYLSEIRNWKMDPVYNALNILQGVPWRVNKYALELARSLWHGDSAIAGLPPKEDHPLPRKPKNIASDAVARKEWRRAAATVWTMNTDLRNRRERVVTNLSVAEKFKNSPALWFPFQCDFRGRFYPVPSVFSPQGDDLARSLMEFRDAVKIETDDEALWLYVHGANLFGIDKVSLDDRVSWVDSMKRQIKQCAADPFSNHMWQEADDPWQFLRWCKEFANFSKAGLGFESHMCGMIDGSCSGIQHYSAMLRDEVCGESVNLVPGSSPRDVYDDVANMVREKLHSMGSDKMATNWLRLGINRKVVKRSVMTLPYGSTRSAHTRFIHQYMQGLNPDRHALPFDDPWAAASWLSGHLWDCIGKVVVKPMVAMAWLKDAAAKAAESDLPITWVSPSNFPVVQAYPSYESQRVRLTLGDTFRRVSLNSEQAGLSRAKQIKGAAPNFIHSMDAAALALAVCEARERGIEDMSTVHDAWGTHFANVGVLGESVRDTFAQMYEDHDVLQEFYDGMLAVGIEIDPPPTRGTLDLSRVRESTYFVA